MIVQNELFTEEIPSKGAVHGHIRFNSKSTKPEDLEVIGVCANVASSLLFERMQAQGTNLIITLGEETRVDVLARKQGDGVSFKWTPKQMEPDKITAIHNRLKEGALDLTQHPAPEIDDEDDEELTEEDEEYLVKQLTRVP